MLFLRISHRARCKQDSCTGMRNSQEMLVGVVLDWVVCAKYKTITVEKETT